MFYLTARFFFRAKLSILGNFRLRQSKSSNFDHPKTCKINKNIFFYFLSWTNPTHMKEPSKMPRLTKRAIAIKENEALAERRVRKAFIRLCFDEEDSLEDDIDQLILSELAQLKASRYCLWGAYRQWDSSWERMLEDGTYMSDEEFLSSFQRLWGFRRVIRNKSDMDAILKLTLCPAC